MARCLRRGRYFAAVIVALCAMIATAEYGAFPHELELVEHKSEARVSWLRAMWIGLVIVMVGLVALVRFSRPLPSILPRAILRGTGAAGLRR